MVIGPPRHGIAAFVVLTDDECLPEKFNHEKVVVFRRGKTTNYEMIVVKELGKLASPELLRSKESPVCLYTKDGNPLHQHADGKWWFFDKDFQLENGPFEEYEQAYDGLTEYCEAVEKMRQIETEMQTCEKCKGNNDVQFVTNPFLLDTEGDDSLHFLCVDCRTTLSDDI